MNSLKDSSSLSTVRWLVVGIGDITRKRGIPAILAQPQSALSAILTRDPSKAAAYPGVRVWTTLEEAVADHDIDAVYVASPVLLHKPQAIAFLRAGRHLLCEKPVAMNYADALAMAEAAHHTGRLAGVAYFRRLFPKLIRAKQLIAEGAIGQPVLGEANCHGWLESEERAWLRDPALAGGGPLYDIGSHRIDAFNLLFGQPMRATGLLSNAVHAFGVEDSATVLIGYGKGIHATIDVRWTSRIARDQFRIIGTEGELNLDPLHGPDLRINGTLEHWPRHENVHYPCIENFAHAIISGTPLMCPIKEAIQTDWVTSRVCGPPAVPAVP